MNGNIHSAHSTLSQDIESVVDIPIQRGDADGNHLVPIQLHSFLINEKKDPFLHFLYFVEYYNDYLRILR